MTVAQSATAVTDQVPAIASVSFAVTIQPFGLPLPSTVGSERTMARSAGAPPPATNVATPPPPSARKPAPHVAVALFVVAESTTDVAVTRTSPETPGGPAGPVAPVAPGCPGRAGRAGGP